MRHGGIATATDLELSIRRLSDDLAALHREVTKPPAILSRVEAPRIQVTYETQHPLSAEIDNPPSPVDENVQFTVYRPHAIKPGRWETLLAFAHLPDAAPATRTSRTPWTNWSDRPGSHWEISEILTTAAPRTAPLVFPAAA